MAITKEVGGYVAFLYPEKGGGAARINVYCENLSVYFLFHSDQSYNDTMWNAEIRVGSVSLPLTEYPHYIDLLRNEGPIVAHAIIEETPPRFLLYTKGEYVGEGEM